jgi:hypothetical protein
LLSPPQSEYSYELSPATSKILDGAALTESLAS